MLDRLTIDRPHALGQALAAAVDGVCARPLSVTARQLALLDARLACGDFEAVLALLRAAGPAPALPLFVARYIRWTGDLQSAAGIWSRVLASLEQTLADAVEPALRHDTCVELAGTATDLGDAPLAARLHRIARSAAVAPSRSIEADPDTAIVCDTAFNIIGIEPDATRGRLRLRPRLDRLDELHVRNIRFGDASVSLRAAREHDRLAICAEQEAGSIPVALLLEPFVTGPRSATVDGQPADLQPRQVARPPGLRWATRDSAHPAGGTILPVQLVLDDARTLVIDVDQPR